MRSALECSGLRCHTPDRRSFLGPHEFGNPIPPSCHSSGALRPGCLPAHCRSLRGIGPAADLRRPSPLQRRGDRRLPGSRSPETLPRQRRRRDSCNEPPQRRDARARERGSGGRSRRAARGPLRPSVPDSRRRRDVVQRSRDLRADRVRAAARRRLPGDRGVPRLRQRCRWHLGQADRRPRGRAQSVAACALRRRGAGDSVRPRPAARGSSGRTADSRRPRQSSPSTWSAIPISWASYRTDTTSPRTARSRRPGRALFLAYPDRFVVGSDTWVNGRWDQYAEIIASYRGWLRELPSDVAAKIASGNGERLFAAALDR